MRAGLPPCVVTAAARFCRASPLKKRCCSRARSSFLSFSSSSAARSSVNNVNKNIKMPDVKFCDIGANLVSASPSTFDGFYFGSQVQSHPEDSEDVLERAKRVGVREILVSAGTLEEAKAPGNDWEYIAEARYFKHPECENYLLEQGCPEPTDEQYVQYEQVKHIFKNMQ